MSEYHIVGDQLDNFRPNMMKRSMFLLVVATLLTCYQFAAQGKSIICVQIEMIIIEIGLN